MEPVPAEWVSHLTVTPLTISDEVAQPQSRCMASGIQQSSAAQNLYKETPWTTLEQLLENLRTAELGIMQYNHVIEKRSDNAEKDKLEEILTLREESVSTTPHTTKHKHEHMELKSQENTSHHKADIVTQKVDENKIDKHGHVENRMPDCKKSHDDTSPHVNNSFMGPCNEAQNTCYAICFYNGHHVSQCNLFLNMEVEFHADIVARFQKFKNIILCLTTENNANIRGHDCNTNMKPHGSNDDISQTKVLSQNKFHSHHLEKQTPRVQVKIRGKQYYTLMDTGCSRCCIANTLITNQKLMPVTEKFLLVGARQEIDTPRYKTNIKLSIPGHTFPQDFLKLHENPILHEKTKSKERERYHQRIASGNSKAKRYRKQKKHQQNMEQKPKNVPHQITLPQEELQAIVRKKKKIRVELKEGGWLDDIDTSYNKRLRHWKKRIEKPKHG
ncbi:hypothetical protein PR048_021645 [Dryococelus australis]|uniref:Retropepsins domain-containing protein n=1 Tax=Dryococelus australis TaxID=614101 RepID=A0ABQ9GYZ9_9NEOP|nr:hypothetical protein PR048_021645 [Dryococelus australis]